jgi:aminoglycoside phosphotransferase (APT) family kinase protein
VSTPSSDVDRLAAVSARLGVDPSRVNGRRLNRGVTHETVLVEHDGVPVAVLRMGPPTSELLPGLDVAAEGRFLAGLPTTSVPIPELLLRDLEGSVLGRPGLLAAYAGGANPTTWEELRAIGGDAAAQHALELLLELHTAPDRGGSRPGLDGSARARLAGVERLLRLAAEPDAEVLGAIAALGAALPEPVAPTWGHGDFRPANLIVEGGRIAAVLDWEMAGWGDPTRDFGIATMSCWGTWWSDAELLRRYRDAGGAEISLTGLRWWRCLGFAMVAGFTAARAAMGWPGGPALNGFKKGLSQAWKEWEEAR